MRDDGLRFPLSRRRGSTSTSADRGRDRAEPFASNEIGTVLVPDRGGPGFAIGGAIGDGDGRASPEPRRYGPSAPTTRVSAKTPEVW